MREFCSCGAAVHAFRRRAVLDWRTNHLHTESTHSDDVQVPPTGGTSQVEMSYQQIDLGARAIGFSPNP